jgi:hypothetical protein
MTSDIVIRTWKPDLGWLEYCLAFLQKNWLGDGRIIIIANSDCRDTCERWTGSAEFIYLDPWPDTHEFKTYCALLSPDFSQAELILNVDSDTMLVSRSAPGDFLKDGRPVINYFEHADQAGYAGIWLYRPALEHWFGSAPHRTYMVASPFTFWRSSIAGMRSLIEKVSGKPLKEALYSDQPFDYRNYLAHPKRFPDWECIGCYCDLYEHDRYYFNRVTENPIPGMGDCEQDPRSRFRIYHSWTQWNPGTRAELDAMLQT